MTGLDADMEAKVGAKPSGTKLGSIPHGNSVGRFGAKWAIAAGMVEVTTSVVTVLAGVDSEQQGLTPSWQSVRRSRPSALCSLDLDAP